MRHQLVAYLGQVAEAIQKKEPIDLQALQASVDVLQAHLNEVWTSLEEQEEFGLESLDEGWRDCLELYQEALNLAVLGAVEPGPEIAERLRFTLSEAADQATFVRQNVELINTLITEEMSVD